MISYKVPNKQRMEQKKLCFRSQVFELNKCDLAKETMEALRQKYNLKHYCLTNDGYLYIKSSKNITLNNRMNSLKKVLGLKYDPKRLTINGRLPDEFLMQYYDSEIDTIDISKFRYFFGDVFADEYLKSLARTVYGTQKNRARNKFIQENDIATLVKTGTVTAENVDRIKSAKQTLDEESKELDLKPDLNGPYTYTFVHGKRTELAFVPSGEYPQRTIIITGRPHPEV